jgi:hypothetical protein
MVGQALAHKAPPSARPGSKKRRGSRKSPAMRAPANDFAALDSSPLYFGQEMDAGFDGQMDAGLDGRMDRSYSQMLDPTLESFGQSGFYADMAQMQTPARSYPSSPAPAPPPPPPPPTPQADSAARKLDAKVDSKAAGDKAGPPPGGAEAAGKTDEAKAGAGKKDDKDKAGTDKEDGKEEGGGAGAAGGPGGKKAKGKGEAGGKGKAKGKGKGGGGAGGKLAELIFVHDRKEPVTGHAMVPREQLRIAVDVAPFSAPRSLPFSGVKQDKKQEAGASSGDGDFRSLYADAAAAGFQLYQQLNTGARQIADEAERLSRQLADRHGLSLDTELARLDHDLAMARSDIEMGRVNALDVLHEGTGRLRSKVWGASASALAKLDKLYTDYTQAMAEPQGNRTKIVARSNKAVADLKTNSDSALEKLKGLSTDQSPAHSKEEDVWTPPINEAITLKLPERAAEEYIDFEKMVKGFRTPLEKLDGCLPCRFELAFADMDGRVKNVHELGPKAVKAARDAGLTSIGTTEVQLEDMIERGAAGTDDTLVKQHDLARARYIESAKGNAANETARIEGGARAQARTLTAMASGQSEAVERVVDRLGEEKQRPESEFGKAAATASRRLRASLLATTAKQPAGARAIMDQLSDSLEKQAERFDGGIAKGVGDAGRGGTEMVTNSLQSFGTETDKALAALKPVPGTITTQCASFLDPVGNSYTNAVADLSKAVTATGAQVDGLLTGQKAEAGGDKGGGGGDAGGGATSSEEPQVCTMDDGGFTAAEPVMSSVSSPPPKVKRAASGGKPKAAAGGKPAPPPAKCDGCMDEPKAEGQESGSKKPPGEAPKAGEAGAPKAAPSDGADQMTVNKMIELSGKIGKNVLEDKAIKDFQSTAIAHVTKALENHANAINSELGSWFPDGDVVVRELRGTTQVQGSAYRAYPRLRGGSSLDSRIRHNLWDGWAMPGTIRSNIRAAINALDGRKGEAAFNDLEAAYNWSDQNERAEQALMSLSAPEFQELRDKHGDELLAMAKELSGANRKKFEALIGIDPEGKWLPADQAAANYNGLKLEETMKSARDTEGEKGWDKTGKELGDASRSAGASRLSGNDDPFGLGSGKKREEHDLDQWKKTQLAYGKATGAVAVPKDGKEPSEQDQLDAAQKGIIDQATKTITHHHEVNDGEGGSYEWDTVDEMGDRHKLWIQRIVKTGADSKETRAAQLGIEANRKDKANRDGLDDSMHFGSADAIEGGHYNEKARAEGLAKAQADQDEVLKIYAQDELDRESSKEGVSRESKKTPDEIREELKQKISAQFGDDEKGRKDALGILSGPKGDALATLELAIGKENKEVAIKQLQRMDAKEIEKLIADYKAAHPGEKGLEEQLGINGHHWNWHNWNGATFSGDAANEIEIAFMGVPQDPKERGEVALRIMDQQTDQSGWLGEALAGDEYAELEQNATNLRKLMGVNKADVDSRGRIHTIDPQTGLRTKFGHFDEKGDFEPAHRGEATAFERAIALSRITADNYMASVDKIANFVATALVVIAAVVTTALTGGAAASIWIPVLVTAGAGLVGVGLNMAIKGGRYSRDEIVRDLVSTVVQAATAGIGAAAGVALRGGTPALKALAGTMRMSEKALAEVAAKSAGKAIGEAAILRSLTLAEEVAIGAGTSALASGANAAFDPASMRRDDYWSNILHSMGRGAAGGGLGALGARGGSKAFEWASKKLGSSVSQKAMATALAAGKSEAEAIKAGERALAKHWANEIGGRAFGSAASGMASRGGEMMYDKEIRGQKIGYGEILHEMGVAGLQNFIQGVGEGTADRYMRGSRASRAAEQNWQDKQHGMAADEGKPHEHAGSGDAEAETARVMGTLGVSEAPAAKPGTEGAASGGKPATPQAETPPAIKTGAPAEEGVKAHPLAGDSSGEGVPIKPAFAEEEAARLAKQVDPDAEGPDPAQKTRTSEEEPVAHSLDDDNKTILKGANDDGPDAIHESMDLSKTEMVKLGTIPEGSVFIHPDSTNVQAANDNFTQLIGADPSREVSHLYNPITGENIIVQGGKTVVGVINAEGKLTRPGKGKMATEWMRLLNDNGKAGHWILRSHYHPNMVAEGGYHPSLPSGAGKDFSVLIHEALAHGYTERTSRIYYIDNGKLQYTDFAINLSSPTAKYTIDVPDPATGKRLTKPFATMEAYHSFLTEQTGGTFKIPKSFQEPDLVTGAATGPYGARRALESGASARKLGAGDIFAVHEVHLKVAAGAGEEAKALVKQMGLVGEHNSAARLDLVLNARALPIEVRQALADTVFEATRDHMVATGQLGADEKLHMFFHGAPEKRSQSLKDGGIQLGLVGSGHNDDFGQGLYLTYGKSGAGGGHTGLENAEIYAGRDIGRGKGGKLKPGEKPGDVFSFFVRERDMVVVVDVSKSGAHRDAWEKFSMKHLGEIGEGVMIGKRPSFEQMMKGDVPFGTFDASGNRGAVFEKFLLHLAETTGQPHLANPDIVFGELGGPFTSGYGIGEQAALRVKAGELARLMNEQIGFRKTGVMDPEPALPMKDSSPSAHALTPDETNPVNKPKIEAEAEKGLVAGTAEGEVQSKAVAKTPEEEAALQAKAFDDSQKEAAASAALHAQQDRAIAAMETRTGRYGPELGAEMKRLMELDRSGVMAVLLEPDPVKAAALLEKFRTEVASKTGSPEMAERHMRSLDLLAKRAGPRFQVEYAHILTVDQALPAPKWVTPKQKAWMNESPVLHHLAMNHPALFREFHAQYMKNIGGSQKKNVAALFERYVLVRAKARDAALYAWMKQQMVKPLTHDKGMAARTLKDVEFGSTFRTPVAGDVADPARAKTGTPVTDPADVKPGLRVDHPELGKATVVAVIGDRVILVPDTGASRTSWQPEEMSLADFTAGHVHESVEQNVKFPEPIPADRNPAELAAADTAIDKFREEAKLPPYKQGDKETGTVAVIKLNGETFHGTSAGLEPQNYSQPKQRRRDLVEALRKKGSLEAANLGEAPFVSHAEAEALLLAHQHFGSLPEVLEIYVDRPTCPDCDQNLVLLAQHLGVKELRVYYRNMDNPPRRYK